MMSFRGKAGQKECYPVGLLTALACHPPKQVNQAWEITYLSVSIEQCLEKVLGECFISRLLLE